MLAIISSVVGLCSAPQNNGGTERAAGCARSGHDPGTRLLDTCLERSKAECTGMRNKALEDCAARVGQALLRAP